MLEQKASNALASTRWVNGHPGKVCPTSLWVIEVENELQLADEGLSLPCDEDNASGFFHHLEMEC